jgi:hypothetical protein
MKRVGLVLGALLMAAPAAAHQETVAYSRLVIRESGDVEYALKIPVEDLAETAGKSGHAQLNAPEVRAAQELFFQKFQPLVGISSGGAPCPVERAGIEVPEDDRLYGELRFVFHCPPGARVTLDYRVFFDVDPGHMGMLEIETAGGKARAELISQRPRWQIDTSQEGPPQVSYLDGTTGLPVPPPAVSNTEGKPDTAAVSEVAKLELAATVAEPQPPDASVTKPAKLRRSTYINWMLIAVGGAVLVGAFFTLRVVRSRAEGSR